MAESQVLVFSLHDKRIREVAAKNWWEAVHPAIMLRSLPRKCSSRKLRLFACACCYHVRDRFEGEEFWELVLLCERLADDRVSRQEVKRLTYFIQEAGFHNAMGFDAGLSSAGSCNLHGSQRVDRYTAQDAEWASDACARYTAGFPNPFYEEGDRPPEYIAESAHQALILRDIFGDPSRTAAFAPRWRTRTVLGLAEGAYEDRDFTSLPVLADALEEAGCDDNAVLQHCRSDGCHHRACWVLDLILGKQ